jgi:hypothetical protein
MIKNYNLKTFIVQATDPCLVYQGWLCSQFDRFHHLTVYLLTCPK